MLVDEGDEVVSNMHVGNKQHSFNFLYLYYLPLFAVYSLRWHFVSEDEDIRVHIVHSINEEDVVFIM